MVTYIYIYIYTSLFNPATFSCMYVNISHIYSLTLNKSLDIRQHKIVYILGGRLSTYTMTPNKFLFEYEIYRESQS